MHLEIRDGRELVCQAEVPQKDRKEIVMDCVIPPVKAFWSENFGRIFVYHPNMLGSRILTADPNIKGGVATQFFRARSADDPASVRVKKFSIKAIIFE